jgi:superfamily II DNA or RNA helicase
VKTNQFEAQIPNVADNRKLRKPQREGYAQIQKHFTRPNADREIGLVLPVGCGKSGLIAIAPFALMARRVLVLAPGLRIAHQLLQDFDPTGQRFFYAKCAVLPGPEYPEPAEIRSSSTSQSDLEEADVVVTNIHQLQGKENKWLTKLPADFFDLILIDEGHHNVAESWELLRNKFPSAKIINFSATPTRADGQLMAGKIIYSYPISEAIAEGFIKRLKAVVLKPATLMYVRKQDGREIKVTLDEVIRLGEEDSDFRRSIVSSEHSLGTIVDCSIRELRKLRERTGDNKHKIIASALNHAHCIQITAAYQARGVRAAYIHSKLEGDANNKILAQLDRDELDVIVQVRKLGEGFDHPYLSVAAICSVFSNLSPFIQFVGRIMRAIKPDEPKNPLNQGVVVFHTGSNIAERWSDFRTYSTADQKYFQELLPIEEFDFASGEEILIDPNTHTRSVNPIDVRDQSSVALEEIPLLRNDAEALRAIQILKEKGYSAEQVSQAMHQPLPTTKQKKRRADRSALDNMVKTEARRILHQHGINPKGKALDTTKPPRENFVVVKSALDRKINKLLRRGPKHRSDFTQDDLDRANTALPALVNEIITEVIHGKA